jgi:hypothetical protein
VKLIARTPVRVLSLVGAETVGHCSRYLLPERIFPALKGLTDMHTALIRAGLALSIAFAASSAWATAPDLAGKMLQQWVESGDTAQQRKDVDAGSRPPPPSGPSSQTLTCNPSSVDCP